MDLTRFDDGMRDPAQASISLPGARHAPSQGPELSAGPLQVNGAIDDADSPSDVLDLLILEAFTSGRQPFSCSTDLDNVLPGAPLLPHGARVIRDARYNDDRSQLATGQGWTCLSARWKRSGAAKITVTAITQELAAEKLAEAMKDAVQPKRDALDSCVPIGFWYLGGHGPRRIRRDIGTQTWPDIRANYSEAVTSVMDPVMALDGENLRGRVLLVHGPPGTGKTSLMRTLARQWRSWCQMDCVLDPERLFNDPSYLLDVALGNDAGPSWRLLLLEDCDELISGEAKYTSGQNLSRLLNLTDGLLGQGRQVLVAITTNERLAALHPAIVRPGRALVQVEVGRLPRDQARAWLQRENAARENAGDGSVRISPEGATLAELFALRAGGEVPGAAPVDDGTGLYL